MCTDFPYFAQQFASIPNTKVMKPMISHRKDIVEDKTQELVQVLSKKPDREHVYKNQVDGFLKHACCRLLIFWSVITTLSSVVSIYYAVETQNRLSEITSDRCVSSIHYFDFYELYT